MRTIQHRIQYDSRADVFTFWFLGCLHFGAATCNEAAIRATVRAIAKDPLSRWFGLGDIGNFISPHDKRFRVSGLAKWARWSDDDDPGDADIYDDVVQKEIKRATNTLKPIRNKCLGMVYGNHESKQHQMFDRNVHRAVCNGLGVDNLQELGLVRLVFNRGTKRHRAAQIDILIHHGYFAGRTDGAKMNNLHRLMSDWQVDIIAVSHGHKEVIAPKDTMRINQKGEAKLWRRYGVMTGSFLETYVEGHPNYASEKLYPPSATGAVRLFYKPNTRGLSHLPPV